MNLGLPPTAMPMRETPVFLMTAARYDSGHAVWRMLRAQRVKANGPTPPSTSMQRVVMRERVGQMHSIDEHHPDL